MKKRYSLATLLLTVCAAVLLTLTAAGANNQNLTILIDGTPLQAAEDAYITENGFTMVPLRALSEALGFYVGWNQDTRTVSISSTPLLSGVVVLDPGHGGESTGAVYDGISEKDLNLAISKKAAGLLEAVGFTVIMTRTTDHDVGLYDRTALASLHNADLFVSIHCNASVTNPAAAGIYTAAYNENTDGWTLSETLRQHMTSAAGAGDMGTEARPDLAVLRTASMPAALVECGYMSTPSELALLIQPEYQAKLAQGIADGIIAYLAPGA